MQTRALVLVQRGQILAEAYAPGVTPDTRLMGWSMGKSLVALMLGWLEQRGTCRWASNVCSMNGRQMNASIKIKDLLQMTSGLAFRRFMCRSLDATRMLFMEPRAASVPLQSPLQYRRAVASLIRRDH